MTAYANIELYKNDSEDFPFTVVDGQGNPSDIQTALITLKVQKYEGDPDGDYAILKSSAVVGEIEKFDDGTPENRGKGAVHFLPQDIEPLENGLYVYSMRAKYGADPSKTVLSGNVIVLETEA